MRGIGQGQTITLMVIPEMSTMIRDCLGAAGNSGMGLVQSGSRAAHLEFVAAWLIVNGLKSEQSQVLLPQKFFELCHPNSRPSCSSCSPCCCSCVVVVMVMVW